MSFWFQHEASPGPSSSRRGDRRVFGFRCSRAMNRPSTEQNCEPAQGGPQKEIAMGRRLVFSSPLELISKPCVR